MSLVCKSWKGVKRISVMESWEQFLFPQAKKKVKRESNKFRNYVQFYAELLYKSIVTEQGVCCIVYAGNFTLRCSVFGFKAKQEKSKRKSFCLEVQKGEFLLVSHLSLTAKSETNAKRCIKKPSKGKETKTVNQNDGNKPIWKCN